MRPLCSGNRVLFPWSAALAVIVEGQMRKAWKACACDRRDLRPKVVPAEIARLGPRIILAALQFFATCFRALQGLRC